MALGSADIDWLVEGVLPKGELVVLFGPPYSGKTYLALDLMLCVATSLPWQGRKVSAGPVIYVPTEGRAGLRARVRAWLDWQGIDASIPELFVYQDDLDLTSESSTRLLKQRVIDLGAALVVVDTFLDVAPGIDENSTHAGECLGRLRLGDDTGASCVAVHHSLKYESDTYRGSSSLKQVADMMVSVAARSIRSVGGGVERTDMTLTCQKSRNSDPFDAISLSLARAGQLGRPVVVPGIGDPIEMHLTTLQRRVLNAVPGFLEVGVGLSDVVKGSDGKKSSVAKALDALRDRGLVANEGVHGAPLWKRTQRGDSLVVRHVRPAYASIGEHEVMSSATYPDPSLGTGAHESPRTLIDWPAEVEKAMKVMGEGHS